MHISDVILEIGPRSLGFWVVCEDFVDRVGKMHRDWETVTQLAGIVIQLGQTQDSARPCA
jgi:predicted transcriptional regulator